MNNLTRSALALLTAAAVVVPAAAASAMPHPYERGATTTVKIKTIKSHVGNLSAKPDTTRHFLMVARPYGRG